MSSIFQGAPFGTPRNKDRRSFSSLASQPILEEGPLPLNTPRLPAQFSTPPQTPSQLQYIPTTPSRAEVTLVHSSDSRFYLSDESPFVPRSYITTTRGSTTLGPVTTDLMESLDRTRSLLSEQRDQELAHRQRERQRKNEEVFKVFVMLAGVNNNSVRSYSAWQLILLDKECQ